MKQLIRIFKWAVINALLLSCAWMGAHDGISGAANIAVLYVWLAFVVSLFGQADRVVKNCAEHISTYPIPGWLDVTIDLIAVAIFVWHGWWWTGVAYLLHTLLMGTLRSTAKELMAANAEKAA